MIPNKNIFCNSPWFEIQIYWNGDYGICCTERHKVTNSGYDEETEYNIKHMSLKEWYSSNAIVEFRKQVLGSSRLTNCERCYVEERNTGTSRRHKQLQKSALFLTNFEESYLQSPNLKKFTGEHDSVPIDFHIDLGNYCNLACKMCWSGASSTIAKQNVIWGDESARPYLGVDWTRDQTVWDRFCNELLELPIKNLHFMGGETTLQPRFKQLLKFLLEHNRQEINFSFVNNCTNWDQELVDLLLQFNRVGLECSIETASIHNNYIRQGSVIETVLENIQRYKQVADDDRITVTARPVISSLSIGNFHTLLKYCLDNKILMKSNPLVRPDFMMVKHLPSSIKKQYAEHYNKLVEDYNLDLTVNPVVNESDPNKLKEIISIYIREAISLLNVDRDDLSDIKLKELKSHCEKWDSVYGFNMIDYYPELEECMSSV